MIYYLLSPSNRLTATQHPGSSKAAHDSSALVLFFASLLSAVVPSPFPLPLLSSTDAQTSLCPSRMDVSSLALSNMTNIHHVFLPADYICILKTPYFISSPV